jgi:hypothetical protein
MGRSAAAGTGRARFKNLALRIWQRRNTHGLIAGAHDGRPLAAGQNGKTTNASASFPRRRGPMLSWQACGYSEVGR